MKPAFSLAKRYLTRGNIPMPEDQEIHFDNGGITIGALLATPDSATPSPGVLIIPGIFGLNENIRKVIRRFAELGYAALAVDIFARIGGGPAPDLESAQARIGRIADAAVMGDLNAASAYLRALPTVTKGAVGVWGVSLGGRYAILAAAFVEKIAAAATISALVVDKARTVEMPASATERAQEVACPILSIFGEDDPAAEPRLIQAFRSGLAMSGQDHSVRSMPGGHNLLDESGASYNAESARLHWQLMDDFFRTHLD